MLICLQPPVTVSSALSRRVHAALTAPCEIACQATPRQALAKGEIEELLDWMEANGLGAVNLLRLQDGSFTLHGR